MFSNELEFKGAVIGMLLGDGCIPKLQGRSKNNHLQLCHSIKQKAYLLHKKEVLSWLTPCRVYELEAKVKDKMYSTIILHTRTHPFFTSLRSDFYPIKKKVFKERVIKMLTIHGLARWYQDDGCLLNHEDFLTPFLCTHGFSKTENELLAHMLEKNFGLKWTLRKDKQYYALRLRRRDRQKFYDLISPFVHESMQYKIQTGGKKIHVGYGLRLELECKHCKVSFTVPYKQRNRKYCSSECSHHSKRKDYSVKIECKYCRKLFIVPYSKRKTKCCSHKCFCESRFDLSSYNN